MDSGATVFTLFIIVGGSILLALIWGTERGKGHLRIGQAEIKIDFDKGGVAQIRTGTKEEKRGTISR